MSDVNNLTITKARNPSGLIPLFTMVATFLLVSTMTVGLQGCDNDNDNKTTSDASGGGADNDTNTGDTGTGTDEDTPALKDAKVLIEHNATDEDTGFQGFFDGDPWNELVVTGPGEERILSVTPGGGLFDFGMTELFFETSEPENAEVPIENVTARLAEGAYQATGDLVDAESSSFSTTFTHSIPVGPDLVSPEHEATGVDPSNLVIAWNPVSKDLDDADVDIVGYQVIVEEDVEPQFAQGFAKSEFNIYLPDDATSVSVPAEFMGDDKCYKYEVLAIEESGNQTLSGAEFETGEGCDKDDPAEDDTPKLTDAKLLIEHNATDEDTGFQGFGDGDPWNQLTITGPDGTAVVTAQPEGGLHNFGLTEFFFETSEPPNDEVSIADVIARLAEGNYTFTGDMVDGDPATMTATFTHDIPQGPVLTSPADGATDVDPENTAISWEAVTRDINGNDITIVGYQVIVELDEDPEFPAGFAQPVYSVYMPASATRVSVPKEFIESGETYAYEVLAIEESGNQTLSSAEFETQ